MAITQAICTSFKQQLLGAEHNFTTGTGHTFNIALYTSSASIGASTTVYTTTGEHANTGGYSPGGMALTVAASMPAVSGSTALADFDNATWSASTITARGALIYNTSAANKAIVVLDFGSDKSSQSGDFTILFPAPDASNAIIRIT
jgi:hypothetical protein